jgi:hypothetical protein
MHANGCRTGTQTAVNRTKVILSYSAVSSATSSGFKLKVRRGQMSRMTYGMSMESRTQVECVTTV